MIYGQRFIDMCGQKFCPIKSDEYSYLSYNVDLKDIRGAIYTHTHFIGGLLNSYGKST